MFDKIVIDLIEVIVLIIAIIISKYVVPWIKSKTDLQKFETILNYADIFVHGAEQLFNGVKLGEGKLEYVTEQISLKAKEIGINLDANDIRLIIENAVKIMNEENN